MAWNHQDTRWTFQPLVASRYYDACLCSCSLTSYWNKLRQACYQLKSPSITLGQWHSWVEWNDPHLFKICFKQVVYSFWGLSFWSIPWGSTSSTRSHFLDQENWLVAQTFYYGLLNCPVRVRIFTLLAAGLNDSSDFAVPLLFCRRDWLLPGDLFFEKWTRFWKLRYGDTMIRLTCY